MSSKRREFLACVLDAMHTYYRWGGKEPSSGLDCSGLVTWALWKAGGPDWRATHSTDELWAELPAPTTLRPGDICLYGSGAVESMPVDPTHVAVWLLDPGGGAGGIVVDASGGDHTTTDQVQAIKRGAQVKAHRSHLYRRDLLGFRSLPLDD